MAGAGTRRKRLNRNAGLKMLPREFPGDPGVRTLHVPCRGRGLDP